jgi:hypothetical protein
MGLIQIMRAGRTALATMLLAPFLVAGNHCAVAALSGVGEALCQRTVVPTAQSADHSCCSGETSGAPAPPVQKHACCLDAAPIPDAQSSSVPELPATSAVEIDEDALAAPPAAVVGSQRATTEHPPEPPPAASGPARAPPTLL